MYTRSESKCKAQQSEQMVQLLQVLIKFSNPWVGYFSRITKENHGLLQNLQRISKRTPQCWCEIKRVLTAIHNKSENQYLMSLLYMYLKSQDYNSSIYKTTIMTFCLLPKVHKVSKTTNILKRSKSRNQEEATHEATKPNVDRLWTSFKPLHEWFRGLIVWCQIKKAKPNNIHLRSPICKVTEWKRKRRDSDDVEPSFKLQTWRKEYKSYKLQSIESSKLFT